jgi:hypothetical protein
MSFGMADSTCCLMAFPVCAAQGLFSRIRKLIGAASGASEMDRFSDAVLIQDVPRQGNMIDCGFFVIGFMEAILSDLPCTDVTQASPLFSGKSCCMRDLLIFVNCCHVNLLGHNSRCSQESAGCTVC